jgi:hypothetical protein
MTIADLGKISLEKWLRELAAAQIGMTIHQPLTVAPPLINMLMYF